MVFLSFKQIGTDEMTRAFTEVAQTFAQHRDQFILEQHANPAANQQMDNMPLVTPPPLPRALDEMNNHETR